MILNNLHVLIIYFFIYFIGTIGGAFGARTSMAIFREDLVIAPRRFHSRHKMRFRRSRHRKAEDPIDHFWRGVARGRGRCGEGSAIDYFT